MNIFKAFRIVTLKISFEYPTYLCSIQSAAEKVLTQLTIYAYAESKWGDIPTDPISSTGPDLCLSPKTIGKRPIWSPIESSQGQMMDDPFRDRDSLLSIL